MKNITRYSLIIVALLVGAFFAMTFSTESERAKQSNLEKAVNKSLSEMFADGKLSVSAKEFNPVRTRFYNSTGEIMRASKIWQGVVVPTGSTQAIDISSAGFTVIRAISITGENNTSTLTSVPFAAIKSYTTNEIQVAVITSNNQVISLLGTNITGLLYATGLTGMKLHVTVTGD